MLGSQARATRRWGCSQAGGPRSDAAGAGTQRSRARPGPELGQSRGKRREEVAGSVCVGGWSWGAALLKPGPISGQSLANLGRVSGRSLADLGLISGLSWAIRCACACAVLLICVCAPHRAVCCSSVWAALPKPLSPPGQPRRSVSGSVASALCERLAACARVCALYMRRAAITAIECAHQDGHI